MHMRSLLLTVVAPAFVLALAACGGQEGDGPAGAAVNEGEQVVVDLHEQNTSGQSGTMTLEPAEGRTRVVLEITEADVPQPAHIHAGNCDDLDPAPAYGLPNVVDGRSESTVDASVEELVEGDFAVNVHRSDDDLETYVACGDIDRGGSAADVAPGRD